MTPLWLLLSLHMVKDISAQNLSVFQPGSKDITEGGTVTLECTYRSAEESSIGIFNWFYYRPGSSAGTEVSDKTDRYNGRFFRTNQTLFFSERKADITIQGVRVYDMGLYVCEVELFNIGLSRGNGTWLQVVQGTPTTMTKEVHKNAEEVQIPMNFILQMGRTVVVLLIFSVSVLIIVRCYSKKEQRSSYGSLQRANI